MALDHFVPQVHLRQFIALPQSSQLHAIRKKDGFRFAPRTRDICRIEEGNTNSYLEDPRAIEDYLRSVEPNYRAAVASLRDGTKDESSIQVVAGFTAYVASCSPTAMRVMSDPLRHMVANTAAIMEARGALPPPPEALGARGLSELIRDGVVQVEIDGKFPQAIGVTQVRRSAEVFESFDWEVLHNPGDRSPFLTSDYPVALEATVVPGVTARVVPLAPDLAVRIIPRLPGHAAESAPEPTKGRRLHRTVTHAEVAKINLLIVRSAESVVFFDRELPWIATFIERNKGFRVEPVVTTTPTVRGRLLVASLVVAPVRSDAG